MRVLPAPLASLSGMAGHVVGRSEEIKGGAAITPKVRGWFVVGKRLCRGQRERSWRSCCFGRWIQLWGGTAELFYFPCDCIDFRGGALS